VDYFIVLTGHSPGVTEELHEKFSRHNRWSDRDLNPTLIPPNPSHVCVSAESTR